MSELTVILKSDDKTYKEKFLIYEAYAISVEDSIVKECIAKAKASFKTDVEETIIRVSWTL